MAKFIAVYDGHTRKRLAYLQNAYAISYIKNTSTLWTGSFTLPYSDPKTKYCQSFNLIDIWDEDGGGKNRYVGLFRIMPRTEDTLGCDANIVYQLEHAIGTLFDDVMIGYHEVGNSGVNTAMSIGYILNNQSEQRWVLKDCDYAYEFLYGWQSENLLSALFSIVKPFEDTDYYWSFDTTTFPWSLSLKRTTGIPKADIRYKKNLSGLTRTVDPTNLTTRLYCYGYGDGDNVLGISEVNGGLPYVESANVSKYGVITQTWTDEQFTVAESLLAVGKAMLRRLEEPAVTYGISIQTVAMVANLDIGDVVRIVSIGLDELMTVTTISKNDVTGAPQSGKVELGAGTIDVSTSLAELADRQRISETYSQGAESIFTDSFVDNADVENPAEVTFIIPDNVVHVNEIVFSCNLTNFRAYSKAVKGGGGGDRTTDDGGSSTVSSRDGGANTLTSLGGGETTRASYGGGGQSVVSASGGGQAPTTSSSATVVQTVSVSNVIPSSNSPGVHNHGLGPGLIIRQIVVAKDANGKVTDVAGYGSDWAASGDHYHNITIPSHNHTVSIPDHAHTVYLPTHQHDVYIPAHSHGIDLPAHSHTVDIPAHHHDFALPNHTHDIEYGIYKGPVATAMSVYLDDKLIGAYDSSISNVNLIDYMSKNANGDIMRGKHIIKIIPSALTRVECVFQIRLFTNMHGGKQY